MTKLYLELMNRINKDEQGQGMVEYGLIVVLVSIAAIVALTAVGGQLSTVFNQIDTALTAPAP